MGRVADGEVASGQSGGWRGGKWAEWRMERLQVGRVADGEVASGQSGRWRGGKWAEWQMERWQVGRVADGEVASGQSGRRRGGKWAEWQTERWQVGRVADGEVASGQSGRWRGGKWAEWQMERWQVGRVADREVTEEVILYSSRTMQDVHQCRAHVLVAYRVLVVSCPHCNLYYTHPKEGLVTLERCGGDFLKRTVHVNKCMGRVADREVAKEMILYSSRTMQGAHTVTSPPCLVTLERCCGLQNLNGLRKFYHRSEI